MPVYKDKERNTWFVQFVKKDNGKSYTFKKRGFKTKKEASAFEMEYRTRISFASQMTVNEIYKTYLDDISPRIKKSSMRVKKNIFNKYISPTIGTTPIKQITAAKIMDWQAEIFNLSGSDNRVHASYTALKAAFRYFVRFKGLELNPFKNTYCISKYKPSKFNYWTLDDFHTFIHWIEPEQQDVKIYISVLIIKILFFTGIRWGELEALTVSDFDFSEKTLSITKSRNKQKEVTSPKTQNSIRTIHIPDFLLQDIQAFLQKLFYNSSAYLFSGYRNHVEKLLKRAATEIPLPYIRIHDLRHSNASLLIQMNYTPAVIKYRLGHSSIATTMDIYANMYKSEERKLVQALDILLQNTESGYIRYPVLLFKKKEKLYISFPDFPKVPALSVHSFADAYAKGTSFLQKEVEKSITVQHTLPEPSEQYVTDVMHAELLFYVNVFLPQMTEVTNAGL